MPFSNLLQSLHLKKHKTFARDDIIDEFQSDLALSVKTETSTG